MAEPGAVPAREPGRPGQIAYGARRPPLRPARVRRRAGDGRRDRGGVLGDLPRRRRGCRRASPGTRAGDRVRPVLGSPFDASPRTPSSNPAASRAGARPTGCSPPTSGHGASGRGGASCPCRRGSQSRSISNPGRDPNPRRCSADALDRPRGGERAGRRRLHAFLGRELSGYADGRDDLAADATSRLSPYLRFGCLSASEVATRAAFAPGSDPFVRQLAWRDFFLQLLADDPKLAWRSLRDHVGVAPPPVAPERAIEAWREGCTGLPLVDAGMRQLRREGWMHNRARLVTASVLTRRLGIPWQEGARHFCAPADRRRSREQRRQLAVGRRHRDGSPAGADPESGPAGEALRPQRRLRPQVRARVGRRRDSLGVRALEGPGAPPPHRLSDADRRRRRLATAAGPGCERGLQHLRRLDHVLAEVRAGDVPTRGRGDERVAGIERPDARDGVDGGE